MSDGTGHLLLADLRALLDDAFVRLATAEGDPGARRDAAHAMAEAIADMDQALVDPSRFQEGTAHARSRILSAADALSTREPGGTAAAELARCLAALDLVRWETASKRAAPSAIGKTPLRATVGEPALLDLERGPIRPYVPILPREAPEPPPRPTVEEIPEPRSLTLVELDAVLAEAEREDPEEEQQAAAEPPSAEAPLATGSEAVLSYFGTALREEQVIFDRARVCLEDLALLGSMRRPLPDQGWAGRAEPERRLLARIDAIAACGDRVLPGLAALLEDRPVPDPELTWALVFLFGSIAGEDSAEEAMRLARIAPLDADGMLEAVSDALALAPHPALVPFLEPWLADPLPERRIAALRALSRRGALTTKIAAQATLEADARLAEAGAAALSTSAEPVDSAVFARLFRHPDECVVRAALESALVRRSPLAPRRAAALCEEGRADYAGAARVVAIASGPEAADLLRRAGASGSVTALEALGWYGNAAVIDDLLDHMEGETAEAAVTGLQLITGASLTDAGALPAGAEPFTAAEGPVPPQAILSTDPAAWRDWWKEHGKAAKADVRYRFGHTYGLEDDLGQIEAPHATEAERRIAYLELCARSGGTLPFDAGAFVARQRRQIADWSAHLAQKRGARGGWPVRLERS